MQYMSDGRLKMPILLRGCIGIGHSAATHHSGNYYPMYAHFPGLRVVVPSTPYDAKGLLHHALRCDDPVLFLEHRELLGLKGPVPEEAYEIPFGQAAVVREGKDVTVVALALMVQRTLKACDQLAAEGISVELIDPRTVAPLDIDTIARSVAKTGRLLIVDEAFGPYGIGAEIAAQIARPRLRRSRRPDSPAERRAHADAVQSDAGGRGRAQCGRNCPGDPRPSGGVRASWRSRSPFRGLAGTWTRACSSAGSSRTAPRVSAGESLFTSGKRKGDRRHRVPRRRHLADRAGRPQPGDTVAGRDRDRLPGPGGGGD